MHQLDTNGTPPFSNENERGVLSCMLQSEDVLVEAVAMLDEDHFWEPLHKVLFEVLREVGTNDILQFGPVARRRNANLLPAVNTLTDLAPSAAQYPIYAQELERLRKLRQAREICIQTAGNIHDDSDATEIIDDLESGTMAIAKGSKEKRDLSSIIKSAMAQVETWQEQGGAVTGIPTGLRDLDNLTMGIQPSEMFVLAARPSVGKTAMALHIANHACIDCGVPTLFFSLEMTGEALIHRILSMRTNINGFSFRKIGGIHEAEAQKISAQAALMCSAPLIISDNCYQLSDIRSQSRAAAKKHGIRLIVVDYLQMVRTRSREREQAVAAISTGLKTLAKELNVAVLALCQLNRTVESRDGNRPRMSDLRESGSIEQDADVVSLMYRPFMDEDTIELIIAKQRNGPTGTVVLEYDRRFNKFTHARSDGLGNNAGDEDTMESKQKELLCQ